MKKKFFKGRWYNPWKRKSNNFWGRIWQYFWGKDWGQYLHKKMHSQDKLL